jgi:hypothetical protein
MNTEATGGTWRASRVSDVIVRRVSRLALKSWMSPLSGSAVPG